MKGVVTGIKIKGKMIVQYNLECENGHVITLSMKVYSVSDLSEYIRLMPLNHIMNIEGHHESFTSNSNGEDPESFSQSYIK